ncbi:MAG: methyltransferase domain-containing protein [Candidatus Diapherotrites archaeon]|nr:methyltransferase domain-containing protein [Candidatus Diapherotrites archaeon]
MKPEKRARRINYALSSKRLKRSSKSIGNYDRRTGLSVEAKTRAEIYGEFSRGIQDNFGRTLPYYTPILAALKKFGGNLKGKRILHIASSFSIFAKFLQEKGAVAVPLDFNAIAAKVAKEIGNKRFVRASAEAIPFKENSFDFFVSDNFILSGYVRVNKILSPHSPTDTEILERLHSLLKSRGIGVIKFNTEKNPKIFHFSGKFYGGISKSLPKEFFQAIAKIGFELLMFDRKNALIVLRKK